MTSKRSKTRETPIGVKTHQARCELFAQVRRRLRHLEHTDPESDATAKVRFLAERLDVEMLNACEKIADRGLE